MPSRPRKSRNSFGSAASERKNSNKTVGEQAMPFLGCTNRLRKEECSR
jgi:hypothetical protein